MPAVKSAHRSDTVILFIDVINHFGFPDGHRLLRQALPLAPRLAALKTSARRRKVPVIYVNDNFGQWRSDSAHLLAHCLRPDAPGRLFVEPLAPDSEDYFVLKPMHSAFYQTPLDLLLRYFGATRLILAGLSTASCILCTAFDAKMRDFEVQVVTDCCAARTAAEHKRALAQLESTACAKLTTRAKVQL